MANDEAADRLLRARALAERIARSLETDVEQFKTSGVESRYDRPLLAYLYGDIKLVEIALYAIDDRRHIVFQKRAKHYHGRAISPFKIYNSDDELVSAVVATLRKLQKDTLRGRDPP